MAGEDAHADVPVGTLNHGPSTLAEASFLEQQQRHHRLNVTSAMANNRERATSDPKTSFSTDDTVSTFSCAGDLLPDEATDANLIEAAGTDNDFVAIKRIAHILARRRNIDIDGVMPKLLQMFAAQTLESGHNDPGAEVSRPATALASSSAPPTRKNTKLMAKASGFFSKLRPQLNVDTGPSGDRFSFETGDDGALTSNGLNRTSTVLAGSSVPPRTHRDRMLRKCVSTPLLAEQPMAQQDLVLLQPPLSPVEHSPDSSAPPSEARRASRIPTPAYGSVKLARPRQERESSDSSLLTAIKHSEDVDRRSNSISSSSASTYQLRRGNAFAEAAALRAMEGTGPIGDLDTLRKGSADAKGSITSHASEHRRENVRPMIAVNRHVDHEGKT